MNASDTPRSILRPAHASSSASSVTSHDDGGHRLPPDLATSDDEGDDERDSLLQPQLHQSYTSAASASTDEPTPADGRPGHPARRPTSLSFNAPATRPAHGGRTQTSSSLLPEHGDPFGSYGTMGPPATHTDSSRRRTWLGSGGSTLGRTGGSRADKLKRRLEVTASVVGLGRPKSYDDVSAHLLYPAL